MHKWMGAGLLVMSMTASRLAQDSAAIRLPPPETAGGIRSLTGVQDFVASAPLNLVYVADLDRMGEAGAEQQARFSATDAGFIAQNVYLFCASADLATVVRELFDHAVLAKALELGNQQRIILAQPVGDPAGGGQ